MKHFIVIMTILFAAMAFGSFAASEEGAMVRPGVEMLFRDSENLKLIEGKRVGLITNPTGIDRNFNSTIDLLAGHPACKLTALFGPEHGLRGDFFGGDKVGNTTDSKTQVPIFSLYGSGAKAPSPEHLKLLDVLIYDIQDINVRPYTYISTMMASMEAAAKAGKTFIVLDRPDPMGGNIVDGPVLDLKFKSFIGYWTIPYCYGMTPGELALLYNDEAKLNADVYVVKMTGWKRGMLYNETGLPWVPPSTHIPRWDTSIYCAITGGMGELHTVNEGVGYTLPFETVAAPWMDGTAFTAELSARNIPGMKFRPISYKPAYFEFKDQNLSGTHLFISNAREVKPFLTGLHIMDVINRMYPEKKMFEAGGRVSAFNRAMGTDQIRQWLMEKKPVEEIYAEYQKGLQDFMKCREKYLLYK